MISTTAPTRGLAAMFASACRISPRPTTAGTASSLISQSPITLRSNTIQSRSLITLSSRPTIPSSRLTATPIPSSRRHRSQLAPRRTKYRKAHKGRVSIPIGGSTKGTTLQLGTFGLRLLGPTRLTAKQLQSAEVAIKRKIKTVKGAECWMRVFPDVPVCVKGNETRMGKGKGAFEYWACRVPVGRVVFEVGGGGIREEIAKEALRLASAKLPVPTEFISRASPPRLGSISDASLIRPVGGDAELKVDPVVAAASLPEAKVVEASV